MALTEFKLVTVGDIKKADAVAIWAGPLSSAEYDEPGFKPAKDKLEYSPLFGKSIVNDRRNLGFILMDPSTIPTNILVA